MLKKLKKAVLKVQKSDEVSPSAYFYHKYPSTGEKNKIKIVQPLAGALEFQLSIPDDELLAAVKTAYSNLLQLPGVSIGDIVLLLAVGPELLAGTKVWLQAGIEYFSMNHGPILCHGEDLGDRFHAVFIRRFPARCAADTPTSYYDEFKLIY